MDSDVALIFPLHVTKRMRRRHISESMIRAVLGDYDEMFERDDGRTEYWGVCEGRFIQVVLEGEREPYVVVTVIDQTRTS